MIAQGLNGPIVAGDLVRVVLPAPCCGSRLEIGFEFRVRRVSVQLGVCPLCAARRVEVFCDVTEHGGHRPAMLIRLDPPTTPATVTESNEVTA